MGDTAETTVIEREDRLRAWFTQGCDPIQKMVDGLDIGWGGVQRWATMRMPPPAKELHLDVACGYATFLAQLGFRFPTALVRVWAFEGCPPHDLPHTWAHTWGSFTALGFRIATARSRIAAHAPRSQ